MIMLILLELALLCVLVLLIRVAIRRGIARVWEDDEDLGDELHPAGAEVDATKTLEVTMEAVPETGGTEGTTS
ncbi:MAG TPA: hypothetical protein VIH76_01340 [Candidatus Acidoferrales bacterium]